MGYLLKVKIGTCQTLSKRFDFTFMLIILQKYSDTLIPQSKIL